MEVIRSAYLDEKLEIVRGIDFLQYRSADLPTWCPGCGYFGIIDAFYKACRELDLKHENMVTVSGIGCSGRTPIFINSYGFHTLHGRSIPVASGLKQRRFDRVCCCRGRGCPGYRWRTSAPCGKKKYQYYFFAVR